MSVALRSQVRRSCTPAETGTLQNLVRCDGDGLAVIEPGTANAQRSFVAYLAEIADRGAEAGVQGLLG